MYDTTHPLKAETGLQMLGFEGFCPVKDLRDSSGRSPAPATNGVYMVVREPNGPPKFLAKGSGGRLKGKDPNVSTDKLSSEWVEDAVILYVGASNHLQRRIKQLIEFGNGKPVPHDSGRYLWQVESAEDFKVCWKAVPNEKQGAKMVIQEFKRAHQGKRPFANLKG